MAKVKSPVKDYNGTSFGVVFQNGVAETSDAWLIQAFREKGYTVEEPAEEAKEPEQKAPAKKQTKKDGE